MIYRSTIVKSGAKLHKICSTVRVPHPLYTSKLLIAPLCYRTRKMQCYYSNLATVQNFCRETFKLGYCLLLIKYRCTIPSNPQQWWFKEYLRILKAIGGYTHSVPPVNYLKSLASTMKQQRKRREINNSKTVHVITLLVLQWSTT